MGIKDEIEKPVITVVPTRNAISKKELHKLPNHGYLKVDVEFKLVNGEKPYPDFSYNTQEFNLDNLGNIQSQFQADLLGRFNAYKAQQDDVNQKQEAINTYIDNNW